MLIPLPILLYANDAKVLGIGALTEQVLLILKPEAIHSEQRGFGKSSEGVDFVLGLEHWMGSQLVGKDQG